MSARSVYLFDVDGVLADFIYGFTTLGHKLFGTPITRTLDQPLRDVYPGMTNEQVATVWEHVAAARFFWYELPTMISDNERDGLADLCDAREVYFVTARKGPDNVHEQTASWLADSLVIHNPQVIITPKKSTIASAFGTDGVAALWSIDDYEKNVNAISQHTDNSYLLDRGYNRRAIIGPAAKRVDSLETYLSLIYKEA